MEDRQQSSHLLQLIPKRYSQVHKETTPPTFWEPGYFKTCKTRGKALAGVATVAYAVSTGFLVGFFYEWGKAETMDEFNKPLMGGLISLSTVIMIFAALLYCISYNKHKKQDPNYFQMLEDVNNQSLTTNGLN